MSDSITVAAAAFFRQLLGASASTNPDPVATIIGGWERFYLAGISINSSGTVTVTGQFVLSGGMTVSGTLTFANTGLLIQDTDASHTLNIKPGSNLTANRILTLTTGDANRTLTISGDSTINQDLSTTSTTATWDVATATTRFTGALLQFSPSRGFIRANANGVFEINGNSGGDFARLQFGGTSSSFSAWKSNGVGFTARLADDSADAPITGSNLTATGTLGVTGLFTLTGGQIAFPATQSASSDANTLDDYEEGSWTPVIGGAGGTSGQTYTNQIGRYVKVGQLVLAEYYITLSAKGTITGNVEIQGLPFTTASTVFGAGPVEFSSMATNWITILARVQASSTSCLLQGWNAAAAGGANLATADIGNATQMIGTVVYRASA